MTNSMIKNTLLASASAAAAIAAGSVAASADTVTVKSGDTVWGFAQEHNLSIDDIANANNLSDANLIVVGQQIELPEAGSAKTATSTTADAAATSTDSNAAVNADGTATIQSGDTIYSIAARYNVSVATLLANNGGSYYLVAGETIPLTAQAATTSAASASTTSNVAAADASAASRQATDYSSVPAASATNVSAQAVNGSYAEQMLASVNAYRAANGLAPLTLNSSLSNRAQARANESAANNGLPSNHFNTAGEVVAWGWDSASSVTSAWYNETNMMTNGTPAHRNWILNAGASQIGVGIANANGQSYVVAEQA